MRLSVHGEWGALITGLCIAMLVVGLGVVVLSMPPTSDGLTEAVARDLPKSGVKNPVTAVLLNFRAYDTLLEVAVLLTALLGARGLASQIGAPSVSGPEKPGPVLVGFIRIVSPLLIIVSGYLLWVGGHAPGGAFQAGAVLASLGVLFLLCGIRLPRWYSQGAERWLLIAGLSVFLAFGVGVMANGGSFLEYPVAYAKGIILFIEAACTLSIAAILFALFASGNPLDAEPVLKNDRESTK